MNPWLNHPAAGNARAITMLQIGNRLPGVPEPGRSAG